MWTRLFDYLVIKTFFDQIDLLASLANAQSKQKEAAVCATYKLALKLLISITKAQQNDPKKKALLTANLAELLLQPKHRIICIRMAIKNNMEVGNYGVAARFIEMLLPLNLVRFRVSRKF